MSLDGTLMPTVLRIGATRFFFYSEEGKEPPHIHVARAEAVAKFWLSPVSLASFRRFKWHELREVQRLVERQERYFLDAWNAFFRR